MQVTVRLLILLCFVLGMPCLALPVVLRQLDGESAGPAAAGGASNAVTPRFPSSGPPGPPAADGPAADQPAGDTPSPAAESPAPAPENPFPTAAEARWAETLQDRLRALGASYLVLDYNAATGRFRFRCEVDLPEFPTLRKAFQAQSRHPVEAMRQVLGAVEQWHVRAAERADELPAALRR